MAMVFRFKMLSDENDSFLREYEVLYDTTLLGFHDFICDDLGYDKGAMASFFFSDKQWEKHDEYTLMDMGHGGEDGPVPMEKVLLGNIIKKSNERLIFLFDVFGDRAYYLELTATLKAEDGIRYPHTTASEGAPSDQFDPGFANDDGSIFDEAMGDFGSFEGDDSYDDGF